MIRIWLCGWIVMGLCACHSDNNISTEVPQEQAKQDQPQLPHLGVQPKPANIALPFCENTLCINIDIQTIDTNDAWMEQWLAHQHGVVVQELIGLDQKMTLQQAIDAYVEKSDQWRSLADENAGFDLHIGTRIAALRAQYVLVKLNVDAVQGHQNIVNREYFFVADRVQKRTVKLLDLVQPEQQLVMNDYIQTAYQTWLAQQEETIQQNAPEKLYWGQADWFFDGEGIGVHYRAGHAGPDAAAFNIYLTQSQTQKVLKTDIYDNMF